MGISLCKITNHFNNAASTYDNVALVQMLTAKHLVTCLLTRHPYFVPNEILDVGAGTGIITQLLLPHFPQSRYVLNDVSEKMLNIAKKKLHLWQNIKYHIYNIETSHVAPYDLITSNCSMQWTQDIYSMIKKLYKATKILAFSTLLRESLVEWANLYKEFNVEPPTFNYPTAQMLAQYCRSLACQDYFFTTVKYRLSFESRITFVRYLKALGANIASTVGTNVYPLRRIINNPNPLSITYNILIAILQK